MFGFSGYVRCWPILGGMIFYERMPCSRECWLFLESGRDRLTLE